MKKKIVLFLIATMVCISTCIPVGAQTATDVPRLANIQQSPEISTFAEVIEYKTRVNNGIHQYRRWNKTYGYWVDPYWINL